MRFHAMRRLQLVSIGALLAVGPGSVTAQDNVEAWTVLQSTFPSTGGGGIMIKGYDPVITGATCVTTFMAVEPGADPKVYPNVIEFEAVAVAGGTLCQNGKWRSFDGVASGRTSYRVFFKDGVFRAAP